MWLSPFHSDLGKISYDVYVTKFGETLDTLYMYFYAKICRRWLAFKL